MTTPNAGTSCPSCGSPATGAFCSHCGASLAPRACASCGSALGPGARFCHRCGAPAGAGSAAAPAALGTALAAPDRRPWIVAGTIIVLTLSLIIWRVSRGPSPAGTPAAATPVATQGGVPDISQMSPMERFIRLNDRIMMAAGQGDTATVQTFLPMALSAYDQLPAVDTDARYHAALLQAEAANFAAARALADTILAQQPENLIGLALLGTLGELTGDAALRSEAQRRFMAAWDREIGRPNQEYLDHREVLDAFRAGAGGSQ